MLNTFVDVLRLQLFQNMNPLKLSPSNMIINTALPEVTKVDDTTYGCMAEKVYKWPMLGIFCQYDSNLDIHEKTEPQLSNYLQCECYGHVCRNIFLFSECVGRLCPMWTMPTCAGGFGCIIKSAEQTRQRSPVSSFSRRSLLQFLFSGSWVELLSWILLMMSGYHIFLPHVAFGYSADCYNPKQTETRPNADSTANSTCKRDSNIREEKEVEESQAGVKLLRQNG